MSLCCEATEALEFNASKLCMVYCYLPEQCIQLHITKRASTVGSSGLSVSWCMQALNVAGTCVNMCKSEPASLAGKCGCAQAWRHVASADWPDLDDWQNVNVWPGL